MENRKLEGNSLDKFLDTLLNEFNFTQGTSSFLFSNDFRYVGDLIQFNQDELKKDFKGLKTPYLNEIKDFFKKYNLELGTNIGYERPEERK